MEPTTAAALHREAIVIDGTCPLLRRKEFVDWYIEGGVSACAPTVGSTASAEDTLRILGSWHRLIATRTDLMLVERAEQIGAAKASGRLGLVFREADKMYREQLAQRRWSADVYPPPPHHYPAGMETPRTLPNLTAGLLAHGYSAGEVRKILGENWLRVMRMVWGA